LLKEWLQQATTFIKELLVLAFTTIPDQWAKLRYKPQRASSPALLVIKVDEIGDYILFRNFLEALSKHPVFSAYAIHLVGNAGWRSLAEHLDSDTVDSFIWLKPKAFLKKPLYRLSKAKLIRKQKYDLVLYPTFSRGFFIGEQVVKLSAGNNKVGFKHNGHDLEDWQKRISDQYYTQLVDSNTSDLCFEFDRLRRFFKKAAGDDLPEPQQPSIKVSQSLTEDIQAIKPYLLVAPGAGHKRREWPLDAFQEALKGVYYFNPVLQYLVTGGPEDREKGHYLKQNAPELAIHNWAGTTSLAYLPLLVQEAEVVLANETSIPHIAAAVGTPCICASNGNHHHRFHPYPAYMGVANTYIYPKDFAPQNFTYYYYRASDYPIQDVRVESVLEALKNALA
jgi:ADP-heptose:LPS heptosyltransferase